MLTAVCPDIDFLFLAEDSDLIDAGIDLGIPYFGNAPDLGAFESNYISNYTDMEPVLAEYSLTQNYPNPFNPITTIEFTIPERSKVTIQVFDITGKLMTTLYNGIRENGRHSVIFDASGYSSGLYYYRIQSGIFTDIKKMVLLK